MRLSMLVKVRGIERRQLLYSLVEPIRERDDLAQTQIDALTRAFRIVVAGPREGAHLEHFRNWGAAGNKLRDGTCIKRIPNAAGESPRKVCAHVKDAVCQYGAKVRRNEPREATGYGQKDFPMSARLDVSSSSGRRTSQRHFCPKPRLCATQPSVLALGNQYIQSTEASLSLIQLKVEPSCTYTMKPIFSVRTEYSDDQDDFTTAQSPPSGRLTTTKALSDALSFKIRRTPRRRFTA